MQTKQQTIREQIGMSQEEFLEMGKVGAVYYEQGNFEKALTIFEGMVELDPEDANARTALGGVLTQLYRNDEAIEQLDRAIELNDGEIANFVNRAEVRIRKQRVEEAIADLKRAIELDPSESDPGANRARAMVLGLHEAFEQRQAATEADGVM